MIDFKKYNNIKKDVVDNFLRYVKIDTTSNELGSPNPTSENQRVLANLLADELNKLGMQNVEVDKYSYVYASLPGSENVKADVITFLAHLDTSPAVSGNNVQPVIHKNYQGEEIVYPANDDLSLTCKECPMLLDYLGDDIITSSGDTLLGADDKAGIAEIMTALTLFIKNPELKHPEIRICFTPDEEVGAGTDNINLTKLGKFAYTIDGGKLGELEDECFDAHSVKIKIHGRNVHPGNAKNIMINAGKIAAEFVNLIPVSESPEHTENREGFYHVRQLQGDESEANIDLIIRDFSAEKNILRIDYLVKLADMLEIKYPGCNIEVNHSNTYKNMITVLDKHPEVIQKAQEVIIDLGIKPSRTPIRGGTDGSKLCYLGIPTPNIFTGGFLYHSLREWIPVSSMVSAVKVIIALADKWTE